MNLTFTPTKRILITLLLSVPILVFATGNEKGSKLNSSSGNLVANPNQKLASSGIIYYDNLDGANDTISLMARGYYVYYRGTGPQGTTALWYQGIPSVFPSYAGPDTGYVAANYNIVQLANNIDSWLVLPGLNISQGDTISFMSRSPDGSIYPDSIRVMYSAAGDILPEATSWVELGRFKVSTAGWDYMEYYAPAAGTNATFAIRYTVADGGPNGTNSNYIGIDDIMVTGPSGTGINELANVNILITPNPADDILNVSIFDYSGEHIDLTITNILGQQIYNDKLASAGSDMKTKIDISSFEKGIYFVTLQTGESATTRKLVVE